MGEDCVVVVVVSNFNVKCVKNGAWCVLNVDAFAAGNRFAAQGHR